MMNYLVFSLLTIFLLRYCSWNTPDVCNPQIIIWMGNVMSFHPLYYSVRSEQGVICLEEVSNVNEEHNFIVTWKYKRPHEQAGLATWMECDEQKVIYRDIRNA